MSVTAAILAGGTARRFGGGDKSALLVDGQPILARQLAEVRQLTGDVLIVGGAARSLHGVRVVPDRVPGCGPLCGLHTALAESRADTTLVVACDMPYVTAPFLRWLASLAVDVDAVVPQTERGYHPLCAVYTRACLEPAARRLADGRLTVTGLLDDVRVRVVAGEALERFGDRHRLLANVNTWDEYRQIVAPEGHHA